jgi:hypothetical protein
MKRQLEPKAHASFMKFPKIKIKRGLTWRLIQGVETSDSIFGVSGSALKL